MKDPTSYIERFCRRHPNFGLPGLMRYVCIANLVFWLLGMVNPVLAGYLRFVPHLVLRGQVWRVLSFALMPPDAGMLALVEIYFYYWVGSLLEQHWGTAQFNLFFLTGILLTLVYGFAAYFLLGASMALTAHYIYFSMFLCFALMFPEVEVLFFFVLPIQVKWLGAAAAAYFLLDVVRGVFPANLLPLVAVLNVILFCWSDLRRLFRRRPAAAGPGTVNFRRESRRIVRERQEKLYTHKCAVCGRTDESDPGLEFRYCSRCAGYHCFCQDHINNHIHFTE